MYVNGIANNWSDLRSALIDACVIAGWSLNDGILSKGAAFIRLYVSTTENDTEGPGLVVHGGTGQSGASLTGASAARPRMGLPGAPGMLPTIAWPVSYSMHIFDDPDEVYCIINTDIDQYFWLAFGVSEIVSGGSGGWIAATSYRAYSSQQGRFTMSAAAGQAWQGAQGESCPGFFWCTIAGGGNAQYSPGSIHSGMVDGGWSVASASPNAPGVGSFDAIRAAAPHIGRSPNAWNEEAVLIPIHGYVYRSESKCSLALSVQHARYLRIDNYEPGDVITLGSDQWRVYPFYRKNSAARNGGTGVNHSGTFGWAIRYDGP